jgi:hypothetical protein
MSYLSTCSLTSLNTHFNTFWNILCLNCSFYSPISIHCVFKHSATLTLSSVHYIQLLSSKPQVNKQI